MHNKEDEHEVNMMMVKHDGLLEVMMMVVMEMMSCSLLLCYNYKHGDGIIVEVATW
jgi:hypothetical protein